MRSSYFKTQAILASLIFAFVVSLSLTVTAAELSMMSVNQLQRILDNPEIVVLDVRGSKDWTSSDFKIKGAVRRAPISFESWANEYSKDSVLILY